MALVTEDGTGLTNAESYASVTAADTRCASLGLTAWAALAAPAKEIALRKAAQFMMASYRPRWAGRRTLSAQALDWPRYGVLVDGYSVLSTIVPADIANACIDLAYRASTEELLPDLDTGSNQIKVDKTGPLETEYFQNNIDARARFVAVDSMLAPYFSAAGGSGSIRVVRG